MFADYALVDKIHQDQPKITITFSSRAGAEFASKELLEAIAQTKFRATINTENDRYQIQLTVQPNTTKWLDGLIALVKQLSQTRHHHGAAGKVKSDEK